MPQSRRAGPPPRMRIQYCHNLEIECSVTVTSGRQHVVMPTAPRLAGNGTVFVTSENEWKASTDLPRNPAQIRPPRGQADFAFCRRHFDAVLVSMLTTWTRRLIGSIGAVWFFGLGFPYPAGTRAVAVEADFSVRNGLMGSARRCEKC